MLFLMDFTLEELAMNAWPSIQTILYDGWIIRMANGYTKRANSVNPLYPHKNTLNDNIGYCETLFRANKLPVIFKLARCGEHQTIDKRLETLGYKKIDPSSVQLCTVLPPAPGKLRGIKINHAFTDAWIKALLNCNKIRQGDIGTIQAMLKNIMAKKIVVYKKKDGDLIGCGYGVVERGFVGIFDIVIREDQRGFGYGEELVRSLLARAGEEGARGAYLQVVDSNTAARNLYKKLNFKEQYKYWYRQKF
jgi:ribosomal protein S18 acetylase RimI-like enzyme